MVGADGETGTEVDDDDFEVLRESPELADGKFKLEICEWCTHAPRAL